MAKPYLILLLFCAIFLSLPLQPVGADESSFDSDFSQMAEKMSVGGVSDISAESANAELGKAIFLDTRTDAEFQVSHIPGAIRVGYKDFSETALKDIPKNKRIIVYCAVGYRSERVGEKLLKQGFLNVVNIRGSIFDWANRNFALVDSENKPTRRVHAYDENNKRWLKPSVMAVTTP